MYNFNYTPTTLGVQSWREIISGGTQTKKVEYHCSVEFSLVSHTHMYLLFAVCPTPSQIYVMKFHSYQHVIPDIAWPYQRTVRNYAGPAEMWQLQKETEGLPSDSSDELHTAQSKN
jgi:hypothetical protein